MIPHTEVFYTNNRGINAMFSKYKNNISVLKLPLEHYNVGHHDGCQINNLTLKN